jgi:anti-sigma factor RsiW
MLLRIVNNLARWLPREDAPDTHAADWRDGDSSWHNSSHALQTGLDVIEHFEAHPTFPDTMPAWHDAPPATLAPWPRSAHAGA